MRTLCLSVVAVAFVAALSFALSGCGSKSGDSMTPEQVQTRVNELEKLIQDATAELTKVEASLLTAAADAKAEFQAKKDDLVRKLEEYKKEVESLKKKLLEPAPKVDG